MRRVVEAGIWFVLLTGVYLVLISTVTALEVAVGAAVAAVSAGLAVLARSAERLRDRPSLRWLGWLPAVPAAVLADTGRLAVLLAVLLARQLTGWGAGRAGRREPGGFAEVRLAAVDQRYRPAQRALASLAVSLAPGSFVVAADRERGVLRVHRISRPTVTGSRLEGRVGR